MNDEDEEEDLLEDRPLETETVNAADPVVHRERLTKAALRDRDVQRFWEGIFDSPLGREEMWKILRDSGAFDDRFGAGPNGAPDAAASWFHMGARSLGLKLFRYWSVYAREGLFLMQDEHDPNFKRPRMPQKRVKNSG